MSNPTVWRYSLPYQSAPSPSFKAIFLTHPSPIDHKINFENFHSPVKLGGFEAMYAPEKLDNMK